MRSKLQTVYFTVKGMWAVVQPVIGDRNISNIGSLKNDVQKRHLCSQLTSCVEITHNRNNIQTAVTNIIYKRNILGCRGGAVVRALVSHQCGPGSIPRLGVICGLSLLVLYSAPRGFLRVLRFPLSSKNGHLT